MLIAADVRAYICREPVDMRKSIDGQSYLVEPPLAQNPAPGNLFVFLGRERMKVKCLYLKDLPAQSCPPSKSAFASPRTG